MSNPFGFSQRSYYTQLERAGRAGVLLEEYEWDSTEDRLIVKTSQDVQPILDLNKELRNEGLHGDGYSPSREWRRAASIPLSLVHKWLRQGINVLDANDWPKVKRMLNSSEYLYLRNAPGDL